MQDIDNETFHRSLRSVAGTRVNLCAGDSGCDPTQNDAENVLRTRVTPRLYSVTYTSPFIRRSLH